MNILFSAKNISTDSNLFYLTPVFKTILILLIKIEQTKITSRFIETAFNLFDVTGDGHINAKVFLDFWMVLINTMSKMLVTMKKVVNALVINLYDF